MHEIDRTASESSSPTERWPWPLRVLVALAAAGVAVAISCSVPLLREFPLLVPLPVAILACWYLGMGPGTLCALLETLLVDVLLIRKLLEPPVVMVREEIRLALFLAVSLLLGWAVRRLAQQRSQLTLQGLQQQLAMANAKRQLAEERARAMEALRDRDEVLQLALKANGMGLWVWDIRTSTVHWSDEVYRIAGLAPGAIQPGINSWVSLILPEDAARVREAVLRSRESGAEYHQQYRIRLPDGSLRWVESQGRAQRDGEGRPLRVVGVIADITRRKQSEEAMLRTEKLAVAGRLAASVAHEINNPLEAVANLLYLVANAKTTAAAAELAQQALDELMRVALITQQTLKFHRQTGTPKETLLSEAVQTVLALFRGRLRSSQIEVDLRTEREVTISCMPGEVQQIFANLASNAIDAMPQGGRLIVRLRPSHDWRDRAASGMRVTFLDSGTGMDHDTRLRLFEPFFTTKADTGTGLGMWVVAQLVERHHGHVRVWSTRHSGASASAISVFLPLTGAAQAASAISFDPPQRPSAGQM